MGLIVFVFKFGCAMHCAMENIQARAALRKLTVKMAKY